jgi:hypothetical protein
MYVTVEFGCLFSLSSYFLENSLNYNTLFLNLITYLTENTVLLIYKDE